MTTKFLTLLSAIFLTLSSNALCASTLSFEEEKALQLAANGVNTKNANGENQTTMVDANGNLKIVPLDKQGKPIDPNTMVPDEKQKNGTEQQNAQPQ